MTEFEHWSQSKHLAGESTKDKSIIMKIGDQNDFFYSPMSQRSNSISRNSGDTTSMVAGSIHNSNDHFGESPKEFFKSLDSRNK